MIRTPFRSMLMGAAISMAACVAPAFAALPAIFDRVPAEAMLVVTTKNLDEVDKGVSQLLAAIEVPALATPSELLRRAGLGDGIDMTKPIAIALMPGDLDGDLPPVVALLPTTNFDGMMNAFDAEAVDGVHAITIATGETLFVRKGEGGYAVASPMRELAVAVDGRGGNAKSHESSMGAVGSELANASHITVVLKKPLLDMMQQQVGPMIEEQAGMAAMMGGGQMGNMTEQAKRAQEFIEGMLEDGRNIVIGTQAGASGLSFDVAMDFETDSEFGAMFSDSGDSAAMLKRLPSQPFLFALGADFNAPVAKKLLNVMAQMKMTFVPGAGDIMKQAQGMATAVFVSPGGLMGGLFANTISYTATADPKAMMAGIQDATQGGQEMAPGMMLTYEAGATDIDGTSVDAWSVQMDMNANQMGGGMVQQMSMMLFGPGGMGGYIAPGKNGVYQTLSKNSQLLRSALEAEGGDASLLNDRGLSMVASRLPENRTVEAYIGVQSILSQGLQVAAMFGMPMQVDMPEQLPPIGVGVTTDRSAARAATFMPAPVLKTLAQVAMQADQMFGGMGGGGGDDAPPF